MEERGEVSFKSQILAKIDHLNRRNAIKDQDFYNLTKQFFKEYLKLEYEYTHNELKKELHKVYLKNEVKDRLIKFVEDIGRIEYQSEAHSQEDLRKLIETFKELVEILIQEEKIKQTALDKLLHVFTKGDKKEQKRQMKKYVKASVDEEVMFNLAGDAIKRMNALIEEINMHMSTKKGREQAKDSYKEMLNIYNHLHEEAKKDFYDVVNDFYQKLKK